MLRHRGSSNDKYTSRIKHENTTNNNKRYNLYNNISSNDDNGKTCESTEIVILRRIVTTQHLP